MIRYFELIPCNFVGSFKVGDNLCYNSAILRRLVECNEDQLLNKMIVLQCGSILEAALQQIIFRAQNYTREGVPHVRDEDRAEIARKKLDKFATIIDVLKKHRILGQRDEAVYTDLHKLRAYRNKIHIQDNIKIHGVPPDEFDSFSGDVVSWSLELHSKTVRFLSSHYPRPQKKMKHYINLMAALQMEGLKKSSG